MAIDYKCILIDVLIQKERLYLEIQFLVDYKVRLNNRVININCFNIYNKGLLIFSNNLLKIKIILLVHTF